MAETSRFQSGREKQRPVGERIGECGESINAAHSDRKRFQEQWRAKPEQSQNSGSEYDCKIDSNSNKFNGRSGTGRRDEAEVANGDWWESEPDVGRVAHGIPSRVDRLKALGNSIVPEVAFQFFKIIKQIEESCLI